MSRPQKFSTRSQSMAMRQTQPNFELRKDVSDEGRLVFATDMAATYKLSTMILPQLEQNIHGAEVNWNDVL